MFKIEDNIPLPEGTRGKKDKEKELLIENLLKSKDGQSIFVESSLLSDSYVNDVLKNLRKQYSDRKFISEHKKEPIKGIRIWVKFYNLD